jgi:hypothetical protein
MIAVNGANREARLQQQARTHRAPPRRNFTDAFAGSSNAGAFFQGHSETVHGLDLPSSA